jgi:hypothetical protein
VPGSPLGPWLVSFLLTQAIELPITAPQLPRPHRLLRAFGASALTHPLLWFLLAPLWPWSWLGFVLVGEALVVAIEAVYLGAVGARRPLLLSLAANGASLAVGLLLQQLGLL